MPNRGVLLGAGAYLIWGFFPLFFKALQAVPAAEIVLHRIVWSFLFLAILILVRKEWPRLKAQISRPRVLLIYVLAASLLSVNWFIYVWGVNTGKVVETSLGYFINPLVSVLLGVVLLREKLRPAQWIPVALASAGVLYLTMEYGALPWIALSLAFTFGLYGLLKKIAPLGPLHGLTTETAILFLPALAYLLSLEVNGDGAFGHLTLNSSVLLSLTGVVTAMPLLMFAASARAIPLSLVGILQFIAPTCQFLLGVFVYGEPFTEARVIGFGMIWFALGFFWVEGLLERRRLHASAKLRLAPQKAR